MASRTKIADLKSEGSSMVTKNKFIKQLAIFIAIAGVLVGLALSLVAVYEVAGGWGVILGLLVFPLTFVYIPFYILVADGSWNLLLLNYGSLAVSWILLYVADKLEEPQRPRSAIDEPPTQPVVTKDSPSFAIILLIIGGVILAAIICALALRTMQ
jgi:hypothetical protein